MAHILQDFKTGPLDAYRGKASFDWKKLKIFLETEPIVRYQNEIYDAIQNHPDYSNNKYEFQTFDELRRLSTRQALAQKSIDQLSLLHEIQDLRRPAASIRIMMQVSPASTIKYVVGDRLFSSSIMNMGSKRHQKYLSAAEDGKIFGCYCLTEIGHGSNARGMRTTATYDKKKKVFVLNSPDFEAAKCWAGGLGQAATHGTVYAQLILDGTSYGLHAFVVPIRNPRTMLPFSGLKVGDMGEKIGLNGVDNGFVMFDNYEIPRENLLNKVGDVTEDGRYVTPIKDPNKRHGAALGSLSAGRVSIACICETLGIKALTIAIRYAAVRKQFGPDDKEVPILEYQSHQYRLLPYLAAAYVIRIFNTFLSETYMQFSIDALTGNAKDDAPELGMEIHGISSASKPMAGWIMKEAIQECRETCGGHGYLKVAGIGDVRNDHDANLTYEGENHVLIQQTANYLLKLWPLVLEKKAVSSPMQSIDFLTNGLDILSRSRFTAKTVDELCCPHYILKVYQWLVTYLLKSTYDKVNSEVKSGKPLFWAKNDSQVFYAKTLGMAYIQHFYLKRMLCTISECQDVAIRNVLVKLYALFALWSLEKHIPTLYKGEFIVGPRAPALIQDAILKLCAELKDDAVSLIDAVAPPDFIVNSVLGSSDGLVYKRLEAAITSSEYSMNRPKWWHEITNFDLKNKL